ncbi:SDR family NAD(P)-dependent oxidoreductase [Virgibacillus natechei]
MNRFEDKNVVITGSATGVGQTIAHEFAKEGANIFIADIQEPKETISLVKEYGVTVDWIQCDIKNEEQVKEMAKAAATFFNQKINILINNAGVNGNYQLVKDINVKDWENTLNLNLTGTMLVNREIVPYLLKNKSGQIVNTASNVAKRGLPYRSDYVSSKWAILGFTQTLALELAQHNIRVNAVCPGPINVDRIYQVMEMHSNAENRSLEEIQKDWELDSPMQRFIQPEEVANVIKFLCSEESSAMTGQALNVTGGFIMS